MASKSFNTEKELRRQKVVLYESDGSRVTRVFDILDNTSYILKEALGEGVSARIKHERRIMELLANVPGVPHLVNEDGVTSDHALVMEDHLGVTLDTAFQTPMSSTALTDFALRLTRILFHVHQAGVIHKDLNPKNILVTMSREPILIDFDSSTTFAEERPVFLHHRHIVGSLSYMAPEQTGRMRRSLDWRIDLYSLGAILYELACGTPAFANDDRLQLISELLNQEPVDPLTRNPKLAPALSAIILRLLQKEQDQRYQSAKGLLADLQTLSENLARHDDTVFDLGLNDIPVHVLPPSKLIGRESEIKLIQSAFEAAIRTSKRGLLITGPPGVGKTALIHELRPLVTAYRGWFISSKFDQYQSEREGGPVAQIMETLGHLLLIDAEQDIEQQRERLLDVLGGNAALLATMEPRIASLLRIDPEKIISGDPLMIDARKRRVTLDLLSAVASPDRPLVIILDDLQWSDVHSLDFIDTVLTAGGIRGLMLIGTYRESELSETHPLVPMLVRWQSMEVISEPLHLKNLPTRSLTTLLSEMLRSDSKKVQPLSDVIASHTLGNPYDTVELLNALRQDALLIFEHNQWRWDIEAIRRYVQDSSVLDLLAVRIKRLPEMTQRVLETLACLGSEALRSLLIVACGCSECALEAHLQPALEEGLLVLEQDQVVFKHDRVQQATYHRLQEEQRYELKLIIARRLVSRLPFEGKAAELYFDTVNSIRDVNEQLMVIELFRKAAEKAYALLMYSVTERYLSVAITVMENLSIAKDNSKRRSLEKFRHSVLFNLGRLVEADALYHSMAYACESINDLCDVACVQINSLIARSRIQEALELGLALLAKLEVTLARDSTEFKKALENRFELFYTWLENVNLREDTYCAECRDKRIISIGRLIDSLMPAFMLSDPKLLLWFTLECFRLWIENGPCAALVGPLSHAMFATVVFKNDFKAGYAAVHHVLALTSARHYTREYSRILFVFSLNSCYWFESISKSLSYSQRACEALLRDGNVHVACFSYITTIPLLLESALNLEISSHEIERAIFLAKRSSNGHLLPIFQAFHDLVCSLTAPKTLGDARTENEAVDWEALSAQAQQYPKNVQAMVRICRAMVGVFYADSQLLVEQTEALMPLLSHLQSMNITLLIYVLRALALAAKLRHALLTEYRVLEKAFYECRLWLARRAEDAPGNFLFLVHWIDAEFLASQGNFHDAYVAFDRAVQSQESPTRGWYKPLLLERAGLFFLDYGVTCLGKEYLQQACYEYNKWGATQKVAVLERTYGFSVSDFDFDEVDHVNPRSSVLVDSQSIDMLAILRASQMLSSETNLTHLEAKVVELLGSLTGATKVLLILPDAEMREWLLHTSLATDTQGTSVTLQQAGEAGLLPLTVIKKVLQSKVPLLVKDASEDETFAHDPYFKNLKYCSLMVVPILNKQELRAVLMLENHLSRGVFQTKLLDTVTLIAGQLAVSLENARLYTSLEEKVAERTEELEAANQRLAELSVTDSLTGVSNRRRFEEAIRVEWSRAERKKRPLSVAMIDIDYFKGYNDTYGHQKGDDCLRQVAQTCKNAIRSSGDLMARYGGEEFVLILTNTGLDGAMRVVERLRLAVEELQIPHEKSEMGIVTISVGVASRIPDNTTSEALLIECADNALYNAKRNGRNCVEKGVV